MARRGNGEVAHVAAQDEVELERAEASAERDLPVAVVCAGSGQRSAPSTEQSGWEGWGRLANDETCRAADGSDKACRQICTTGCSPVSVCLLRRNGGVTSSASVKSFRSRTLHGGGETVVSQRHSERACTRLTRGRKHQR